MKFYSVLFSFLRVRSKPPNVVHILFVVSFVFFLGLYFTVVVNFSCQRNECISSKTPGTLDSRSYFRPEHRVSREAYVKGKSIQAFLFVVILTSPGSVERRNAMRSTWLNVTRFKSVNVIRRFFIGTADLARETIELLQKEQNANGDILFLEGFKDAYSQLTHKLLKTFVWISEHVDCSFIMKVDDDTFARLDVIVNELSTKFVAVDNLYWGFHRGNSRVKYRGPWAEPNWLLCDYYLPYALGGGYIISATLAQYVADMSSLLMLYNSEDVSLGAWLSPLKLTRVHDVRFDTEWMSRGCRNAHIVSHKQSINDMFSKSIRLRDHGQLCTKEENLRKSFRYSWNVPPSHCCERKFGIP